MWSDIDLATRFLVVGDGKRGKHRVIAINDTLYKMLRDFPRKSDRVSPTSRTIVGRSWNLLRG